MRSWEGSVDDAVRTVEEAGAAPSAHPLPGNACTRNGLCRTARRRRGPMSRVLIAGCGDVGTALGLMLCERGHEVFGARRSAWRLPAPLHPLSIDLADRRAIESALPAVDVVVYAVAAGRRDAGAYRRAYVDGVASLLDVLEHRANPPRRLLFVSSTSVYGERGGAWIDESSPLQPSGFAGESLVAGERRMLASPVPATVVRFAGIYGPGRGWLIERARAGARCAGDPPKFTNRIHRDDCAGFLAHLIGGGRTGEEVYIGVDDAPVEECEVLEWLAARLGAPAPQRVGADDAAGRGGGKRCSNARLRASGYRLRYPTYREGYAAVLAGEGVRYP